MFHIKSRASCRFLLAVFGIGFLVSISLVFYLTFLAAFLNGGSITITVNSIGEAWFEFFLIPVTFVLGVYGFVYFFKQGRNAVEN